MNEYKIKPVFEQSAQAIKLPQFFIRLPSDGGFFDTRDEWHKLAKENLRSNFVLANLDATVNFTAIEADVYAVDAEKIGKGESAPAFKAVKKTEKNASTASSRVSHQRVRSLLLSDDFFNMIGKIRSIRLKTTM